MSGDFDDMLAELRKEYVDSLPEKIADINSNLSANDIEKLRDNFHRLKGTGKTYGIPEISELAEPVELLCANNSGNAKKAVQMAVLALDQIHSHRQQQKPYDIQSDTGFIELKTLK